MEIPLRKGDLEAAVDPFGAYLTKFTAAQHDVLFPRTTLSTSTGLKQRGGCHVCLPQFSRAGLHPHLDLHGFGRTIPWTVEQRSEDHVRLLADPEAIRKENPVYAHLRATMEVRLGENMLELRLHLQNTGESPFDVAPAFHPYFAHAEGEALKIDGTLIHPEEPQYEATAYVPTPTTVQLGEYRWAVEHEHLPIAALWTDQPGAYFCIEPTHSKTSFTDNEGYLTMRGGEEAVFCFRLLRAASV